MNQNIKMIHMTDPEKNRSTQFIQTDLLKDQICLTTLIQDTDETVIDRRDTGVSPTGILIQQNLPIRRPGHPIVVTDFEGDVIPFMERFRIEEQKYRFGLTLLLIGMFMQTSHAGRLHQCLLGSRMLEPSLAQIISYTDSSSVGYTVPPIGIVTHIQHNTTVR